MPLDRTMTDPREQRVNRCTYCGCWRYDARPCSACGRSREHENPERVASRPRLP